MFVSLVSRLTRAIPGGPKALKGLGASILNLRFEDRPFLFDVNGDGTPDIIGKSSSMGSDAWIAAYNGRNGKELWRSEALSKGASQSTAVRALVGDIFLSIDDRGTVQAYRAKTGQPAWVARLSQKAKSICHGRDFVRITAARGQAHDFLLTTGQEAVDKAKATCEKAVTSGSKDGPAYRIVEGDDINKLTGSSLENIRAERGLIPDKGKRVFVVGPRLDGSQASVVAAVEGKKVVWTTNIAAITSGSPTAKPSRSGAEELAFARSRLTVAYTIDSSVRVAAFDTNTGKRLWDVAVADRSQDANGLVMTNQDVYLATTTLLHVFAIGTGEQRLQVGRAFLDW